MAASLGVPASIAAAWQDHGAAIAERWYRSLAPDREKNAMTSEDALGLAPIVDKIIASGRAMGSVMNAAKRRI